MKVQPKTVLFKVKDCKIRIKYKGYTDSDIEGHTNEDDKILGFSKFTMKAEHKAEILEFFGEWPEPFADVAGGSDWEDGSDFETFDTDMFIFYAHFLINTKKSAEIEVEGEHIFWFIHDLFHAMYDIDGKDFSCGPTRELRRFRQAFQYMKQKGLTMSREYIQRIVEAFNSRQWGCEYDGWKYTRDSLTIDGFKEEARSDYYFD